MSQLSSERFLTLNVRGMRSDSRLVNASLQSVNSLSQNSEVGKSKTNKVISISSWIKKENFAVAVLTETKLNDFICKDFHNLVKDKFWVFFNNHSQGAPKHGVATLVNKSFFGKPVNEIIMEGVLTRTTLIRRFGNSEAFDIFSSYIPLKNMREEFMNAVSVNLERPALLMGDFNDWLDVSVDVSTDNCRHDSFTQFSNFESVKKLSKFSGWIKGLKFSFRRSDFTFFKESYASRIDWIFFSSSFEDNFGKVFTIIPPIKTDHKGLILELKSKKKKSIRPFYNGKILDIKVYKKIQNKFNNGPTDENPVQKYIRLNKVVYDTLNIENRKLNRTLHSRYNKLNNKIQRSSGFLEREIAIKNMNFFFFYMMLLLNSHGIERCSLILIEVLTKG